MDNLRLMATANINSTAGPAENRLLRRCPTELVCVCFAKTMIMYHVRRRYAHGQHTHHGRCDQHLRVETHPGKVKGYLKSKFDRGFIVIYQKQ